MADQKSLSLRNRIMNFQHEEVEISKSKKAYGYNYAPLDVILPLIKPYLKKHGIGFFHRTSNQYINIEGVATTAEVLTTVFFSVDNDKDEIICSTKIDENVPLAKMNKFMVIGSAITYFRRYHIVTTLGLTTDEDTDAGGAKPKDNKSKNTPPTSNNSNSGRSVESAKSEDSVNYVEVFANISKTKTEEQAKKMFDMYSKNMSKDVKENVRKLLNDKYSKK